MPRNSAASIDVLDAERERLDRQAEELLREHAALVGADPDLPAYQSYVARLHQHKTELDAYLAARAFKA